MKMRLCSVNECENKHYAKGLCKNHYQRQFYVKGYVPKWKREPKYGCLHSGCKNPVEAKGFCHTHNQALYKIRLRRRQGLLIEADRPTCAATACKAKAFKHDLFCAHHLRDYVHRKYPHEGKYHWSWRGGLAQYPKHSELKRVRKEKLESVGYECQIKSPNCTKVAVMTHHINYDRSDHSWDNLQPCCFKCHGWLRIGKKNTKWKYGVSLAVIARELETSVGRVSLLLNGKWGGQPLKDKMMASRFSHLLQKNMAPAS